MRCFILIASTSPLILFFNEGYIRLSFNNFSLENIENPSNKFTHLTNASV